MAVVTTAPTITYTGGQAKAVTDATRSLEGRKTTFQTRQAAHNALEVGLAGVIGGAETLKATMTALQNNIDDEELSFTSNTSHAASKYATVTKTNAENPDTDLEIYVNTIYRPKTVYIATGEVTNTTNNILQGIPPANQLSTTAGDMLSITIDTMTFNISAYNADPGSERTVAKIVSEINDGTIESGEVVPLAMNLFIVASVAKDATGNDYLRLEYKDNVTADVAACTLDTDGANADLLATNKSATYAGVDASITVNGNAYTSTNNNEVTTVDGYKITALMPHSAADEKVFYRMQTQVVETLNSTVENIVNEYNEIAKFVAEHPNPASRDFAAAQAMVAEMYTTLLQFADFGVGYKNQTVAAEDGSTSVVRLVSLDVAKLQAKIAEDVDAAKTALTAKADDGDQAESLADKFLVSLKRLDAFQTAKTKTETESQRVQEQITLLDAKIKAATERALKLQARMEQLEASLKQHLDFLDALYGVKN